MRKIIIIGSGGHASSCIDVIEQEKKFKIVGLIDNKKKVGTKVLKYKVSGSDKDLEIIKKKVKNVCIGIGQLSLQNTRSIIFKRLKILGFNLPSIISPRSHISKYSKIGEGSIVHHGVIINAGAEIGNNCIINSMSLIEHNTRIQDNCHISTSVTINGDVVIGGNSIIGSKAVIRNSINLKKNSFVKMGEIIKK